MTDQSRRRVLPPTEALRPPLYDRLGGRQVLRRAVDLFYDRIQADDRLRPFFDEVDMVRQRTRQHLYLAFAFGGVADFGGRDLRSAHADAVAQGLSDEHFDVTLEHLVATLEEVGVGDQEISEILEICEGLRDEVLCR